MVPNLKIKSQDIGDMEPNHDVESSQIFLGPNQFILGPSGAFNPTQYAPLSTRGPSCGPGFKNVDTRAGPTWTSLSLVWIWAPFVNEKII